MAWWPRQTPRIGVAGPSRRMTSTETPASAGVQGPGEMMMWVARSAATSATLTTSLRTTLANAPSSRT